MFKIILISFKQFFQLLFQLKYKSELNDFQSESLIIHEQSCVKLLWKANNILFFKLRYGENSIFIPCWVRSINLRGQYLSTHYELSAFSLLFRDKTESVNVSLIHAQINPSKLNVEKYWRKLDTYDNLNLDKSIILNSKVNFLQSEKITLNDHIKEIKHFVYQKTAVKLRPKFSIIKIKDLNPN